PVELVLHRRERRRIAPQLVDEERERRSGRVVAGEQQRHRLIPYGAGAERLAGIVGGAQQQPEHTAAGVTAATSLFDLGTNSHVERPPRRDRSRQWGTRSGKQLQKDRLAVDRERRLECLG